MLLLTLELEHISNFFPISPGNSAIPTRAYFAKPLSAHVPLSQPVPSLMDLLKTMWLNVCAAKKNATLEVVSRCICLAAHVANHYSSTATVCSDFLFSSSSYMVSFATRRLVRDLAATQILVGTVSI